MKKMKLNKEKLKVKKRFMSVGVSISIEDFKWLKSNGLSPSKIIQAAVMELKNNE